MNVVAAQRANVFTRTTTTPDSVPWFGRCVQPAGNAAQKAECLTELVSPYRYRVVRYERPIGVVDRDDQPGRGTRRQSTRYTAFGVDVVGHAAPEVGVPSAHTDGIVLSGFV